MTVWTEVSATSFICGQEGNFSLQLGIPANASWHKVEVTTVDLGGNTNATSIEVLYQEWLDWAIDDAEAGGPILYYGLGLLLALIALIGLTVFMIGRRKEKIREVEENLDNVMDWIDEMVDEPDQQSRICLLNLSQKRRNYGLGQEAKEKSQIGKIESQMIIFSNLSENCMKASLHW